MKKKNEWYIDNSSTRFTCRPMCPWAVESAGNPYRPGWAAFGKVYNNIYRERKTFIKHRHVSGFLQRQVRKSEFYRRHTTTSNKVWWHFEMLWPWREKSKFIYIVFVPWTGVWTDEPCCCCGCPEIGCMLANNASSG